MSPTMIQTVGDKERGQMLEPLLVIARWVFAKAARALLSTGSLDGRRVVTIGEPEELLGLSASFLLRYWGLREVFRVAVATTRGRRSGEVPAVWTAPSRRRVNTARRNIWWRCAGAARSFSKQFAPAFASLRFRSGFA